MSVATGCSGDVLIGSSSIAELTNWTFNKTVATDRYGSNSSNCYKKTIAGVKSGTGTLKGKYDDASPIEDFLDVGDSVSLLLQTDGSTTYTVPAVIKSLDVEVDLDEGKANTWSATFETNGAWS